MGEAVMLIGYLRLSSEQVTSGFSEPHNALIAHGIGRLFMDIETGNAAAIQLQNAIEVLSAGDALVCPAIAYLTNSIPGLLEINARLEAKGASLRVLQLAGGLPLDTATVEGRAILGALAIMNLLPNPVPAPAAAPSVSRDYSEYSHPFPTVRPRGRPATAGNQSTEVNRLRSEGLRAVEIAACLGIGRASVYRILSQGQPPMAEKPSAAKAPRPASGMVSGRLGSFSIR
jgi:DNA invertase Pin-like site-specific DNA recombinase